MTLWEVPICKKGLYSAYGNVSAHMNIYRDRLEGMFKLEHMNVVCEHRNGNMRTWEQHVVMCELVDLSIRGHGNVVIVCASMLASTIGTMSTSY